MSPLSLLALLAAAGLLAPAAAITLRRARAPHLPAPIPAAEPTTVLLPVRDEATNVVDCVAGLLAQTTHPQVRVIDDGSTDGTAELAARAAAAEPRLSLISAGPLPDGWRGKVHALEIGFRGVETPWVLLTDADTRHHPELLARTQAAAGDLRLDAVSLAGFQEARGAGENLLIPAVFALLDGLLGDWRRAARGEGPPVANGQLILLARDAWERCGGFASIRGAVIDDLALATGLRAGGYRTGFLRAPDLLRVRMYHGFGETFRGWRRNLGGLFGGRPLAAGALAAVLLAPPILAVASLATGAPSVALALWAIGAAASATLRRSGGHSPLYGLLFPLDALLLALLLVLGVADFRRRRLASWKGREMRLGP